jgi:hypothetical protein
MTGHSINSNRDRRSSGDLRGNDPILICSGNLIVLVVVVVIDLCLGTNGAPQPGKAALAGSGRVSSRRSKKIENENDDDEENDFGAPNAKYRSYADTPKRPSVDTFPHASVTGSVTYY